MSVFSLFISHSKGDRLHTITFSTSFTIMLITRSRVGQERGIKPRPETWCPSTISVMLNPGVRQAPQPLPPGCYLQTKPVVKALPGSQSFYNCPHFQQRPAAQWNRCILVSITTSMTKSWQQQVTLRHWHQPALSAWVVKILLWSSSNFQRVTEQGSSNS